MKGHWKRMKKNEEAWSLEKMEIPFFTAQSQPDVQLVVAPAGFCGFAPRYHSAALPCYCLAHCLLLGQE